MILANEEGYNYGSFAEAGDVGARGYATNYLSLAI